MSSFAEHGQARSVNGRSGPWWPRSVGVSGSVGHGRPARHRAGIVMDRNAGQTCERIARALSAGHPQPSGKPSWRWHRPCDESTRASRLQQQEWEARRETHPRRAPSGVGAGGVTRGVDTTARTRDQRDNVHRQWRSRTGIAYHARAGLATRKTASVYANKVEDAHLRG